MGVSPEAVPGGRLGPTLLCVPQVCRGLRGAEGRSVCTDRGASAKKRSGLCLTKAKAGVLGLMGGTVPSAPTDRAGCAHDLAGGVPRPRSHPRPTPGEGVTSHATRSHPNQQIRVGAEVKITSEK